MLTTQLQSSSTTDLKTIFSMGFLSSIIGATVKTVLTPVAVVKDAVNIVSGESPDSTKNLLESIVNDLSEGVDDLGDGEIL